MDFECVKTISRVQLERRGRPDPVGFNRKVFAPLPTFLVFDLVRYAFHLFFFFSFVFLFLLSIFLFKIKNNTHISSKRLLPIQKLTLNVIVKNCPEFGKFENEVRPSLQPDQIL